MTDGGLSGSALVYSSSLIAAFLGGVLALFAPCCVVSLMPTFVATALRRGRLRLPLTTLVFAFGVGSVLLPVVWGVGALGHLFSAHHRMTYFVVGSVLLVIGLSALAGRKLVIPMPALRYRPREDGGVGSTFLLGAVSGVVSSCCAPVLVGVIALSALSASPLGGLGLGVAYVFGMVFPLFIATIAWDRWRLGERLTSRLLHRDAIVVLGEPVLWTDLASGVVFVTMAAMALAIAVTGQSTITPDALITWTRWSSAVAGMVAVALGHLPIWAQAAILLLLAGGIVCAIAIPKRSASNRQHLTMDRLTDLQAGPAGCSDTRTAPGPEPAARPMGSKKCGVPRRW